MEVFSSDIYKPEGALSPREYRIQQINLKKLDLQELIDRKAAVQKSVIMEGDNSPYRADYETVLSSKIHDLTVDIRQSLDELNQLG